MRRAPAPRRRGAETRPAAVQSGPLGDARVTREQIEYRQDPGPPAPPVGHRGCRVLLRAAGSMRGAACSRSSVGLCPELCPRAYHHRPPKSHQPAKVRRDCPATEPRKPLSGAGFRGVGAFRNPVLYPTELRGRIGETRHCPRLRRWRRGLDFALPPGLLQARTSFARGSSRQPLHTMELALVQLQQLDPTQAMRSKPAPQPHRGSGSGLHNAGQLLAGCSAGEPSRLRRGSTPSDGAVSVK